MPNTKKVSKNALDDIDKIAILFLNIKQHTRRYEIKLRLMFSKEHYIVLRTYVGTAYLYGAHEINSGF
jgi:hypothetical protein